MPEQEEVLIVDDSEATVVFLSQIVEDNGYRFRVARDGKEAIASIKERRPDLILLDIMMPRKSGINVFRDVKGDPDLNAIPIIIVTGASEATGVDIATGTEAPKERYGDDLARRFGAALHDTLNGLTPEGLIEKPVEPALLGEKLKELLS